MSPRTHPCSIHRAVLLDFVDRAERSARTPAAFDHLDRCAACRQELEAITLTITALRRLAAETAGRDPSPAAWARLRHRLERPRVSRAQVRATLAGLATSAALVGALVGVQTWRPPSLGDSTDLSPFSRVIALRAATSAIAERRLLDHAGQQVPREPELIVVPDPATHWLGPDGRGIPSASAPKAPTAERVR
ncbi:MAG TPA: hypothetical protein VFM38_14175 [Candidatus Limnocylindrales bacterium]|nr:hypothetical protein [Candidatus Limnocylindrales bacterium]